MTRLPVILVNRMTLNLRNYMSQPTGIDSTAISSFHARSSQTLPEIDYAQNNLLDNIEAPLRMFEEEEGIDDDDSLKEDDAEDNINIGHQRAQESSIPALGRTAHCGVGVESNIG